MNNKKSNGINNTFNRMKNYRIYFAIEIKSPVTLAISVCNITLGEPGYLYADDFDLLLR